MLASRGTPPPPPADQYQCKVTRRGPGFRLAHVQYGLRMSENLSAEETATELDAVGVTVADNVVAKVEERTGLPEADQRALLAERAFDPTVLHIRPTGVPRSIRVLRRRLRLLAAAAVLAVATASVVWLASPASPGPGDFDTNSTSQAARDVTEWPLRGNLRDTSNGHRERVTAA